jgi:hypothetical protein
MTTRLEPVAWRVRANRNHPLVERDPFEWRLSETKPVLGEGAQVEWFDVQPLYAAAPAPEGMRSEIAVEAQYDAVRRNFNRMRDDGSLPSAAEGLRTDIEWLRDEFYSLSAATESEYACGDADHAEMAADRKRADAICDAILAIIAKGEGRE